MGSYLFDNTALIAIPNKNLINNIGFNSDATHTVWDKKNTSIMKGIGDKIASKILVCIEKQKDINLTFILEVMVLD